MLKVAVKIFIALSLLLCAGAYPAVIVRSDPPEKLELANNWTLSPVGGLPADGATVSLGDYNDSEWCKRPPDAGDRAGDPPRKRSLGGSRPNRFEQRAAGNPDRDGGARSYSRERHAQDVPAGRHGVDVLVGAKRRGARDHPAHPVLKIGIIGGAEERL